MDPSRLSVSHITTVNWDLPTAVERYKSHGIGAFGPWRDKVEAFGFEAGKDLLHKSGLHVSNYCAAGFFTMGEGACQETVDAAVESTVAAIGETAELGADCLVVVSGPVNCFGVDGAMELIMPSLHKVALAADERGVDLGLEALHPMDITTWSMVRTINQALDIIDEINVPHFGLMLDLYNTWWDPQIVAGIRRAGAGGRIKGVHMADWRNPTRSFTDRTLPGRGIIPLERLIAEVEETGWTGPYDVEIFSDELWQSDYDLLLDETVAWFRRL
ncbi:MAG: sugar phosphate isomerase/epimerase [Thermoleophilia bacterium]|nr:sugar phosphate isomerase/epimerase [Thermoleophilia bacterium]